MKNKFKFLWIDDDRNRKTAAENLENQLNVTVDFINLHRKAMIQFIKAKFENESNFKSFNSIIIDHRLNKITDTFINGPSTAELIRQKINNIPIICITAADIEEMEDHTKDIYDLIIKGNRLNENYPRIISLVKYFDELKDRLPHSEREMLSLLKAPDIEEEKLISIIPNFIRKDKPYFIKELSDWTRKILISQPGFLIDEIWAATISGVKFNSFNKIKNYFDKDIYNGIFENDADIRWWKSSVIQTIFLKFSNYKSILPWEVARNFVEISEQDYSICELCGKPFPEIVGYTDLEAKTRIQLHLSCSIPHPKFEKKLYFEEIRMMKE